MAARTRSRFDEPVAQPRNDAYTGLLALSLLAMVASCVILYLDYAQYGTQKAPSATVPAPARPNPAINQAPTAMAPIDGSIVPVSATVAVPATVPAPDPNVPGPFPPNLDGPELPKPVLPPG
jgi:hypothetical protein